MRRVAEHTEFSIAETQWNMPTGWVHDLPRRLSRAHALEITLWGDSCISAQRCYEIGWINRVVPADKLMGEAM
jgi:enoyl-CoA hydratase/carnithine racemase